MASEMWKCIYVTKCASINSPSEKVMRWKPIDWEASRGTFLHKP